MKRITMLLALSLTAMSGPPVAAHHSFSAVYQADETVRIEGKVVQFQFRNPHSILHVLVPDDSGGATRWAIEWQGATQLGARGMTAQTLRPGDPVVVTGNPGRVAEEHRMLLIEITRTTDGFGWGNRPGEVVD
ncbi:MAG: hypothetical protein JXB36_03405 [Gammaproteobacteria bacterium]|nr:hypothetical protein [Gammaproteobacteria bacterium]